MTMGSCPSQIFTLDFPGQSSECRESTKHGRHQNRSPEIACRLVYKTRNYLHDARLRALFSVIKSSRQATMLLFAPPESLYKSSFLQLRVYYLLHHSRLYNQKRQKWTWCLLFSARVLSHGAIGRHYCADSRKQTAFVITAWCRSSASDRGYKRFLLLPFFSIQAKYFPLEEF
jgi:hypothetical protein